MKINNKELLNYFSFIDYEVCNVIIYQKTNSIIFSLSGALYFDETNRKELDKGYLEIQHFDSIKISSYQATTEKTTSQSIGTHEKLTQICEIDVKIDSIIIKGYAEETFNWLTFEIAGGKLSGSFKEKSE